jgi:zinc protease
MRLAIQITARRALSVLSLLALVALPMLAQQTPAQAPLPAGITRGASVEGITEYALANGMKVLLFPDQSKPTVTVNITYLVGSRHEGYGETGMAHLLEHLVFKGTPKHPNIPQELTERGAFPNGTTWFDRTNYFESLPASDANLEWALDLEADRMVNSFIAQKDLESEFTVVRNEFESGENSPIRVTLQRTMAAAFEWHNYGKSTIGARSDIENVPIERLRAFYRRYYQPDNSILVVAGKFDEAAALRLIAQKFGTIPRPERSLERGNLLFPTYTRDPDQDGEREVTVRRVGDQQALIAMYKVPAGTHPDFAAIDILTQVLARTPGGRLHAALVQPGLVAQAASQNFQLREPGVLFGLALLRKEQSLADARRVMLETFEGFAARPVTAEEVTQAKAARSRQIELSMNSSENIALDLSEWASMGDWRMLFIHRDRLEAVTPADVQRVATTYFKPDNRTVGSFIPTDAPVRVTIPVIADATIDSVARAYRGRAAMAAGEAFDPSPANIDARTVRGELANGFKLVMLPKQTRGNQVSVRVTLRHGNLETLTRRNHITQLMVSMLDKGTTTRSRQQIREEFDRLRAQVSFGGAGNNAVAFVTTTRENLLPTLRLVGEVLKSPSFPASEFDELKRQQLAAIESQRSEPGALASKAFQRRLTPYPAGHPLATTTLEEDIANLESTTIEHIRAIYTELVGASYGDLAIVGDFDRAAVEAWAKETFEGWRSPKPFARAERLFFDVPQFNETIETPDKANAVFIAGQNLRIKDDSPDFPALTIGNFILGGGFLNSRLATRIRQRDGISYGVSSSFGAQSLDDVGSFTASAIYAPENVLRLETAFGEEIGRILSEGITAEELEAARTAWLQQRVQMRANDGFVASMFSSQYVTGRTMAFEQQLEDKVRALTVNDVNAAMRRHISLARMSTVKAGDFANKPAVAPPTRP